MESSAVITGARTCSRRSSMLGLAMGAPPFALGTGTYLDIPGLAVRPPFCALIRTTRERQSVCDPDLTPRTSGPGAIRLEADDGPAPAAAETNGRGGLMPRKAAFVFVGLTLLVGSGLLG